MLKLRIALGLASIVGALTLLNGILQGARIETVLYRIIISIAVFGFIGYGIGIIAEKFLKRVLEKEMGREQETEIINEQQPLEDLSIDSEFAPFTSGNFEQISRPKE
ncbi:hypothetical protein [Pelosinus sp. UFO1]|uniref:hypothetical protein n=1 Tax=Pelosinus sp. UFO1 TaxID=484770 RepID=UPI0004D16D65|nr:hypothetical protein [Pelosinus sp. UFO1]AIF52099.1 hypothetical protein UFO1_2552 [Pelosinus sp. UFO1]